MRLPPSSYPVSDFFLLKSGCLHSMLVSPWFDLPYVTPSRSYLMHADLRFHPNLLLNKASYLNLLYYTTNAVFRTVYPKKSRAWLALCRVSEEVSGVTQQPKHQIDCGYVYA